MYFYYYLLLIIINYYFETDYYGGIIKRKNLLTLLMSTGLSVSIVSIQWFIFGFSLSFSDTGGVFNGDFGKLNVNPEFNFCLKA